MHPDARTDLLDVALACFVQAGLHATSTDAIADAAYISHGRLYRTFASKELLIEAVYAHALAPLQAPLLQAAAGPYERLQPVLERWWQLAATAAQHHPIAFAFWRLYRTSRYAFGTGEPLLGPFAQVPALLTTIQTQRAWAGLLNKRISPRLLATLLTAQWTAVVEVVLTDPSCRADEKLRTRLLAQAFEQWWRSLESKLAQPPAGSLNGGLFGAT